MEENDAALCGSKCYSPLHRDPPPERLYIFRMRCGIPRFLGCLRDIPEWAAEGWKWQRASSGGSVMYLVYLDVLLSRMLITV